MELTELSYPGSALIISLKDFERVRDSIDGVVALTSGGYDPIHPGHISLITETKMVLRGMRSNKKYVPDDIPIKLVVVVNDDGFLERKKGKPFMDQYTRSQIVAGVRNVDFVVPFSPSDKMDVTVCEAIERLRPNFFIKGGDRLDYRTIPEFKTDMVSSGRCTILTGIGQDKLWSSSRFLKRWSQIRPEKQV